jgi:hypothetical protein
VAVTEGSGELAIVGNFGSTVGGAGRAEQPMRLSRTMNAAASKLHMRFMVTLDRSPERVVNAGLWAIATLRLLQALPIFQAHHSASSGACIAPAESLRAQRGKWGGLPLGQLNQSTRGNRAIPRAGSRRHLIARDMFSQSVSDPHTRPSWLPNLGSRRHGWEGLRCL